jgi:hypothetical protein
MMVVCLQLSNHIVVRACFHPGRRRLKVVAVLPLLSIVSDRNREDSKETSSWHSGLDVRGPRCPMGDCGNRAMRLEIGIGP